MVQTKLNDSPKLRADLKRLLAKGLVNVEFVKVDGSVRTIDCTMNSDLIPEAKLPKTVSESVTEVESPVAKVFVNSLQEWRSFRWDSIVSYQ